ncbi:alpha/beta hydrolase family esterase [Ilyomonas limi]|nr:prolyl oligopeptidase family serine peptidase [Ilyomonas limi]
MKYLLYALIFITLFSACQRILNRGGGHLPTGKNTRNSAPTGEETDLVKEASIKRYFLNVNGDNRTFLVQLPKGYDPSQTYPVIFFFHSIHGHDTGWIKNRGVNEYVDKYKYIAVYGQGANGGVWNIGGYYPLKKVSEPNYVMEMYNWLKQNTKIDARRVYAVGTSNGALLAHYLAIQTNIFAAIVPISGSLYTDEMKSNAQPTAVLQIHGMQDRTIPYNGGFTKYQYTFLSAENSVQTWAETNGCNAQPTVTNLLGGKVTARSYTNCKSGKPAILYSISGAAHKVADSIDLDWLFDQVFSFLAKNER